MQLHALSGAVGPVSTASISLINISWPCKRWVRGLWQWGQVRPNCTVGYYWPQSSHTVTAGMVSTVSTAPGKSSDFAAAHFQQSCR